MNKIITIIRESALARFLIPAGVILIVFGVVFFGASKQNQHYKETEAQVISVVLEEAASTDTNGNRTEATYLLGLKYTVDGKEYETDLSGMSKREVGDRIAIYYDPADPSQITQTKSLIIPLVIIAAGIAAVVGGIVSAVNTIRRYKNMKAQEREWTHGK